MGSGGGGGGGGGGGNDNKPAPKPAPKPKPKPKPDPNRGTERGRTAEPARPAPSKPKAASKAAPKATKPSAPRDKPSDNKFGVTKRKVATTKPAAPAPKPAKPKTTPSKAGPKGFTRKSTAPSKATGTIKEERITSTPPPKRGMSPSESMAKFGTDRYAGQTLPDPKPPKPKPAIDPKPKPETRPPDMIGPAAPPPAAKPINRTTGTTTIGPKDKLAEVGVSYDDPAGATIRTNLNTKVGGLSPLDVIATIGSDDYGNEKAAKLAGRTDVTKEQLGDLNRRRVIGQMPNTPSLVTGALNALGMVMAGRILDNLADQPFDPKTGKATEGSITTNDAGAITGVSSTNSLGMTTFTGTDPVGDRTADRNPDREDSAPSATRPAPEEEADTGARRTLLATRRKSAGNQAGPGRRSMFG
jgi:hypothetical protein